MADEPKFTSMADAVLEFAKSLDECGEADFFPTGFPSHDNALGRLRRGELMLVGARPSIGKTAFMLSMVLQQLLAGIKVYFFTLEMRKSDMIARLVSIKTGVSLFDILQAKITAEQARLIVGELPTLSVLRGEWTEEFDIRRIGKLLEQVEKKSRSIVYVDFLGLMQVPGLDAAQSYAITTECGLALKRAAVGLQIPVVAAVQLNRQLELRKDKEPTIADFRDSGRLEEIGDIALGLHRPGFKDKANDIELQVFCLKNRNGPRVNYVLRWDAEVAHCRELNKTPCMVAVS